uniref:Protein kinase domain-containing protein n=1 Tax=Arcella intermedia TaxID=1963864 RepID=A0A6B2L5V4_9EUKA
MPHIGQGTFGIVYKGTVKDRKIVVAIKDIIVKDHTSFEEWKKEVEFMSNNTHKYVVEVYGYCRSPEMLTIVMEFFDRGMLFSMLHENPQESAKLTVLDRLRMARHVSISVAFLHEQQVLHRDVKSMNILVGKNYICKLSDFGSAKLISSDSIGKHTMGKGTPYWMAPEVMHGEDYGLPADVYSLGIVLYEIFQNKLFQYDHEARAIIIPSEDFSCKGIMLPMLAKQPQNRPSATQIAETLNFILYKVALLLNIVTDQSLDELFITHNFVGNSPEQIEKFICDELSQINSIKLAPAKPRRPPPDDIPTQKYLNFSGKVSPLPATVQRAPSSPSPSPEPMKESAWKITKSSRNKISSESTGNDSHRNVELKSNESYNGSEDRNQTTDSQDSQ